MSVTERLDQIKSRADEATKGPWDECGVLNTDGSISNIIASGDDVVCELPHTPQGSGDSYFIAHARDDIPTLVDVVRAVLDVIEVQKGSVAGRLSLADVLPVVIEEGLK